MIQKEEWDQWQQNPVTKLLHKFIKHQRHELSEALISGQCTYETAEGTALKHAEIIGRAAILDYIAHLDYEDVIEGMRHD